MKTEILVPLYFWPYEELSISNYNQTINFIGVGGSSLAWGITFCAIWGFCSIWGKFWDRLEVFLDWCPGGLWCWSDPSIGRKNRQCVERKICNPSLQWGGTNTVFCLGFQFVEVFGMVGDCFSLGVGAWRPGSVRHVVFHVEI